jgi:hypothetical protein
MLSAGPLRTAPGAALWPGLAGLLPFLACAIALLPAAGGGDRLQLFQWALVTYGALILAFVGAIHWGIALMAGAGTGRQAASYCFAWSVFPALWGWLAIGCLALPAAGFVPAIALLGLGFIVQLAVDYRVAAALVLPAWYLALRSLLTSVVLLSLLLASLATAMPA